MTKTQYNELLQRLERARVSGGAEENGVAKFNIVDPPSVSLSPIFPNRPLFLAAVLVMGVGLGAAVAYLLHLLRPVFGSSRSLAEETGLPVLGSVTCTWIDKQRHEMRVALLRYSAASVMLGVVFVVAVVMNQTAARFMRELLG